MRPTEKLLQSCECIGWAAGQDVRCATKYPGSEEAGIYQSLQNYPIIPRTFI